MFCPGCGVKVSKNVNFCPKCGAPTALQPAKVVAPIAAPVAKVPMQNPIVGVIFVGVFFFLIMFAFYAVGFFDVSDTSSQTSNTSNSSTTASVGNGCSPGYCNSNGHCCPSSSKYYCGGKCYYTIDDALAADGCGSFQIKC